MSAAYEPAAWADLFVMAGGATAALAGLIFVALSVNHQQILHSSTLPLVAARTLAVLIAAVVMCALALAPRQPTVALGVEVTVLGVVLAVVVATSTARSNHGPLTDQLDDWCIGVVATVPGVVGGVSLVVGVGGGMYWLMAQFLAALVAATYYAWFLLIEIRRTNSVSDATSRAACSSTDNDSASRAPGPALRIPRR